MLLTMLLKFKKEQPQQQKNDHKDNQGVGAAVLELLRKQAPLAVEHEKFCNDACAERFLRAKVEHVKRAANALRASLYWRETVGTGNLIADEFSAELAQGVAYVAGHVEDSKPVMISHIKQDYQKYHSQKLFNRLLVFALELAMGTMPKKVEQFVLLLFDASLFRSASAFLNSLLATLKIVAENYPGRIYKAFVVHPQSLFSYLCEKFCNNACVERFLGAKSENVKKAAKQSRASLSWRGNIYYEFSAELAEGVAYVAGYDEESSPVMIWMATGSGASSGSTSYTQRGEGSKQQAGRSSRVPDSSQEQQGGGVEGGGDGQGDKGAAGQQVPARRIINIVIRNHDDTLDRTEPFDITDISNLFDFYNQLHGLYVALGFGNRYEPELYRMHPWFRFDLTYNADDGSNLDHLGRYDDRNPGTATQRQARWAELKRRLSYIVAKKAHRHV